MSIIILQSKTFTVFCGLYDELALSKFAVYIILKPHGPGRLSPLELIGPSSVHRPSDFYLLQSPRGVPS